jgi:hypothetical protein
MSRIIYDKINKYYVSVKYENNYKNKEVIIQTYKFLLKIFENCQDSEINNFYMKYMFKIIILPKNINSFDKFLNIVYSNNINENFYILLNIKLSNIILDNIYKLR